MKIQESKKEKMPLSVITSFVSKAWDEVGSLNEMIKGIKNSFTNTGKIEEYMQNIADAYLICIGQMEAFMQDKKYVDVESAGENIASAVKEALKESVEEEPTTEETQFGDHDLDKLEANAKAYEETGKFVYDDNGDPIADDIDEDWMIDWSIDEVPDPGAKISGKAQVSDTTTNIEATPDEIEAAKREIGGNAPRIMPITEPVTPIEKHPVEDDFYIDFGDEFPEPSNTPLSNDDIEALQGKKNLTEN